ncbi:MAG TPA: L-threonylcarbamoyladenylate synthase, partial [Gemmatimonadaceae bacterium]|nr:L-threonylcarbamoyladenylate synthase [Gemmatimonadaceae bacterium]
MRIVKLDPEHPDAASIALAATVLRSGGLVAFPTETVYGLGANALDAAAVERIYAAKGRPQYNPLIVHVAAAEQVLDVARDFDERARRLAARFWPGPLTIVLPKRSEIPDSVTAGLPSVAVRVPSHGVAQALLRAAGVPVAAPSANRSTQLSPTTAAHVAKSLGDMVDLILDGGPTTVGIESTVVDLTGDRATLLRPGIISVPELEAVIGPVALATNTVADRVARASPGQMERHYSPRAELRVVDAQDVAAAIATERARGGRAGAVLIIVQPPRDANAVERMSSDAAAYAAELYSALHRLDDAGCDTIIVEQVPNGPQWLGVRDRLARASRATRE